MRKIKNFIIVSIILSISFSACTKYEEGPAISILTPDMRITGEWETDKFYVNGNLQGDGFKVDLDINRDNTGTSYTKFGAIDSETDFEWRWGDDKTILEIRDEGDENWQEFLVTRLTNKEMWLNRDMGFFGEWEIRYVKK